MIRMPLLFIREYVFLCEVHRESPPTNPTSLCARFRRRRVCRNGITDLRARYLLGIWGLSRMSVQDTAYVSVVSEKTLRRQIDYCLSRALVDREYARLLLADPTVVLEDRGCPPQQYLSLRSIEASNLQEFARQARALFWTFDPFTSNSNSDDDNDFFEREALPLTAAAS
jgi:hypothetical protein